MLVAAAADRNKEPILGVLRQYISPTAPEVRALEVASGTGQHAAHFARALPNVRWLPSELDRRCLRRCWQSYIKRKVMLGAFRYTLQYLLEAAVKPPYTLEEKMKDLAQKGRSVISEYIQKGSLVNMEQPRTLDASQSWKTWGLVPSSLQMVVCINMIHISEPSCTQGLFNGAGQVLQRGGVLLTYGPYSVNGILTPQSNIDFHQSLKNSNPDWGIWDTSQLQELATTCGLTLETMVDMPANNKCLIFRKI